MGGPSQGVAGDGQRLEMNNDLRECVEIFEYFNTSNSGRISRDEFVKQFPRDEDKAKQVFELADINGDGSIEFNEFATIYFDWTSMSEAPGAVPIEKLLEALRQRKELPNDYIPI